MTRRERVWLVAFVVVVVLLAFAVRDAWGATSRASAFGPGLYGNRMACGGALDESTRAVAHRWLACGSRLRICYSRRCASARVRDRGPYVSGRTLDLSEAVVRDLGYSSARAWGVRVVVWRVTPTGAGRGRGRPAVTGYALRLRRDPVRPRLVGGRR